MSRRKLPETEEVKMNMTPMIDMTFLLVVFFMLTIDLTTKEFLPVSLPFATQGEENKDRDPDHKRFVINLEAGGWVEIRKNRYDLSKENPVEQDRAVQDLKRMLKAFVEDRRAAGEEVYEPDGACKVPVLIHADRAAHWKYVQWIMQVAADPSIKIYKLQFSVKRPPNMKDADAPAGGV
ncbi:MAG: ExbD/TolR family protein [Planctomycetota bacterium]